MHPNIDPLAPRVGVTIEIIEIDKADPCPQRLYVLQSSKVRVLGIDRGEFLSLLLNFEGSLRLSFLCNLLARLIRRVYS